MVALTLRSVKGSPLTNTEIDTNFSNLNTVAEAALPKTGGTMAGVLAFLAGTVSAPGLAVAGDLNTGIDGVSADVLGVIAGGTIVQTWGVGTSTLTGAVAISRSATNSTGGLTLVNQNTSGWGTSLSFQGTLSGTIDTARILSQHPTAGQGELQFQTALSSALGTRMTIAPTGATTITVADATSGVPLTLSTPSSSAYSLRLLNRTYSTSLPVFSYFPQNDGVFLQGTDQATAFRIYTNGFANPRLSITATGDVGIGTTSPSTLFHVNGVTTLGGNLLTSADATHDLGTSGSGRFRDAYFSRNLVAGAGVSGGSYLRVNGTNSGYIALGTADDVLLYRDVANVLALRNSTNGQTFRVYGTYTDASNWERMSYGSNGVISMQAAGTGSMRDLNLQGAQVVLSTGSSPVGRWLLLAAGHFVPQADNTYDLGSTGNRIRSGYFGTSVVLGTGVTAASLLHLSGATGATLNTIYEPSGWSGLKSRVGNQYRGDGLVSSVNVRLTSATAGTLDDATQPGSGLILLSDGSLSLVNATAGAGSRTFAQIFGVSSAGVVTLYNNVLRSADNTYDFGASASGRARNVYVGTKIAISNASLGSQALDVWAGAAGAIAAFQSNSVAANGQLVTIQSGNAVTGSVIALYMQGAATGNYISQLQNSDANGGARFSSLVTGAGDPFMSFEVNGGTTWSHGLDNSDSDSYKISQASSLGTNDRLTILTTGNVGLGNPTAITYRLDVKGGYQTIVSRFLRSADFGEVIRIGRDGVPGDAGIGYPQDNTMSFLTIGTERLRISGDGHLLAGADNTYDIGASGANRPRIVYIGTRVVAPDGTNTAPSFAFGTSQTGIYRDSGGGRMRFAHNGTYAADLSSTSFVVRSDIGQIGIGTTADVLLNRDAANTLALRNGVNAQTFSIYRSYTDASNYSRLRMFLSGSTWNLTAEALGTGSASALSIQSGGNLSFASAGTTEQWRIDTGNFLALADNTYDIGASGATRARSIYAGTSFVAPDGTDTAPSFAFGNSQTGIYRDSGGGRMRFAHNGTYAADLSSTSFVVRSDIGQIGIGTTADVLLNRDAANTLALRNGTNAQSFRVYNTWTDSSNYERAFSRWSSNVYEIGTEAAGTGAARATAIRSGNSIDLYPSGTANSFNFTTGGMRVGTTHSIGWSNATGGGGGAWDTWLDRISAGKIRVTNSSSAPGQLQTGGLQLGFTAKTANYTATLFDHVITTDAASASFTITLPTAVGCAGQSFLVKKITAANVVTVATTSSQTIDGLTTRTLNSQWELLKVTSDGANWLIT